MLLFCPQKKGVVRRLAIVTPRKPNSARRCCMKLFLTNKMHTIAYVPGSGHTLRRYSTVHIQGRGARDLPGIYCRCIRGTKDLKNLPFKGRRRSVWGVKRRAYRAYIELHYNRTI